MPRNKELINNRNILLKKDFDELYNKKRLRHDDCLEKLSEKYFITKETVIKILFKKPQKSPEIINVVESVD
jgi:hypothetical protein